MRRTIAALGLAGGLACGAGRQRRFAQQSGGVLQASFTATARPACRSTRRRRSRRSRRSWASSTIWSCSSRTKSRTGPSSSSPNWPKAGRGTRTTPGSASNCARASNGMTASRSPPADVKCTWDLLIGKSAEQAAPQPAQGLVPQPRRGRRPTATTRSTFVLKRPQPAFLMLLATGMSPVYPCHVPPREMRQPPDRHRPVQVRRVQAQRIHQAGQEPGLLEAGPALSRRHRVDDRAEPRDPEPRLYRRQVRHDLSLRGHGRR